MRQTNMIRGHLIPGEVCCMMRIAAERPKLTIRPKGGVDGNQSAMAGLAARHR
jgi:hypothetical protein